MHRLVALCTHTFSFLFSLFFFFHFYSLLLPGQLDVYVIRWLISTMTGHGHCEANEK